MKKDVEEMTLKEIKSELSDYRYEESRRVDYEDKYQPLVDFIYDLNLHYISRCSRPEHITITFNKRDSYIDEIMVGTIAFFYYKKELISVNGFVRLEDAEKMKDLYNEKVNKYLKKVK